MRADPRVEKWMFGLNEGDRIVTCPIVRGEILFGISRLPVGRRRSELEQAGNQFLDAFHCEPVPEVAGGCNVSAVPIAPLCDVVGILHPHEGVHIDAERLLEAQGHFAGEIGFGVWETGKRWAGYAKNLRRIRHGKTVSLDIPAPRKRPG